MTLFKKWKNIYAKYTSCALIFVHHSLAWNTFSAIFYSFKLTCLPVCYKHNYRVSYAQISFDSSIWEEINRITGFWHQITLVNKHMLCNAIFNSNLIIYSTHLPCYIKQMRCTHQKTTYNLYMQIHSMWSSAPFHFHIIQKDWFRNSWFHTKT